MNEGGLFFAGRAMLSKPRFASNASPYIRRYDLSIAPT